MTRTYLASRDWAKSHTLQGRGSSLETQVVHSGLRLFESGQADRAAERQARHLPGAPLRRSNRGIASAIRRVLADQLGEHSVLGDVAIWGWDAASLNPTIAPE